MAFASAHWDSLPGWNPDPEDTADRDGRYVDPEDLAEIPTPVYVRPVGPRFDHVRADVEDVPADAGGPSIEEYLPL